jgi:hypothetical protein
MSAAGEAFRDPESVGARQENVKQDELGSQSVSGEERRLTVSCRAHHGEAVSLEELTGEVPDACVIVHDEHGPRHVRIFTSCPAELHR